MALPFLARSVLSHARPAPRAIRYFSNTFVPAATTARLDPQPEWVQHAEAFRLRELEWKRYRRARNWRWGRNLTFASLGFAAVYFTIHYPSEETVTSILGKSPKIKRILDDAATKSPGGEYVELGLEKAVPASLTDETLRGVKLLGPRRAYWSQSQQELLHFQWFGALLSGWPTVVHGGAIATTLSEAMSTAAALIETEAGTQRGSYAWIIYH